MSKRARATLNGHDYFAIRGFGATGLLFSYGPLSSFFDHRLAAKAGSSSFPGGSGGSGICELYPHLNPERGIAMT